MSRGPGRPEGEPTKVLSFRVPKKLAGVISAAIKRLIKTYVH